MPGTGKRAAKFRNWVAGKARYIAMQARMLKSFRTWRIAIAEMKMAKKARKLGNNSWELACLNNFLAKLPGANSGAGIMSLASRPRWSEDATKIMGELGIKEEAVGQFQRELFEHDREMQALQTAAMNGRIRVPGEALRGFDAERAKKLAAEFRKKSRPKEFVYGVAVPILVRLMEKGHGFKELVK